MKKLLLFFIALLLLFSAFSSKTLASENFSTDANVTYTVSENGSTHINFKTTLTNRTSNYYASSYKMLLGVSSIRNLSASDSEGPITADVEKTSDGSSISLTFNKRVVGLNNKLDFNVSFDSYEIASSLGNIWEVNIPGLSNQSDFSSFNVNVVTPYKFGVPSYIKPAVNQDVVTSSTNLHFTKDQLGKSGIYISYGQNQVYTFDLKYHLYNKNLFPITTEIAIPPKTNYQDIEIDKISPEPSNIRVDKDGNWLAQYLLLPSQKKDVSVLGKAKLSLYPSRMNISNQELLEYLKEKPYWQTSNPEIKKLAQNLGTPQAIYQYVVKSLSYDFSRVSDSKPRLGATAVLSNPSSAVCLEFTDLFVTLARASGIPAREVDGFAFTKNTKERPLSLVKDVLHAWPEYYDKDTKAWVMVDPTWGNTTGGVDYFNTLDFDHFTFVTKGLNSSYPVPAGGYKLPGDETKKDVIVNVGGEFDESKPVLTPTIRVSKGSFPWSPISAVLTLKNNSNKMSEAQNVTLETNFLSPKRQNINIEEIPPYGSLEIPVNFRRPSILTNKKDVITIRAGGETTREEIPISPFSFSGNILFIGGLFAILVIVISTIATKPWNLRFFRQGK